MQDARRGDSVPYSCARITVATARPDIAMTAPTPKVKAVMAAMSTGWPVTSTKP